MKKMYKYILVITLMMFGFIGEVSAKDEKGEHSCVEKNTCSHLCKYYNDANGDEINIYYEYASKKFRYNFGKKSLEDLKTSNSGSAFISKTTETQLAGAVCPASVYYTSVGASSDKVCFESAGENYCVGLTGLYHLMTPYSFVEQEKVNIKPENIKNVFQEEVRNKTGLNITTKAYIPECLKKDECQILCYYTDNNLSDMAYIVSYYSTMPAIKDRLKVWYSWYDARFLDPIMIIEDDYSGEDAKNYRAFMGAVDYSKLLYEGKCPENIYKNSYIEKEVCFDNGAYCQSMVKFGSEQYLNNIIKEKTPETKKEEHVKKIKELDKDKLSCDQAKELIINQEKYDDIVEVCGYTRVDVEKTKQFFTITRNNQFEFFSYENDSGGKLTRIDPSKVDAVFGDQVTCVAYSNFFTSDYYDDSKWSHSRRSMKEDRLYMYTCNLRENSEIGIEQLPTIDSCESLLGTDLRNEINSYFLYIKIAVPIILIVMGSLDFGRAFIASDEDAMKKAQKRFIMRLIIAMVIFFIPSIVNALLNIADKVWNITRGNGTCKIGF